MNLILDIIENGLLQDVDKLDLSPHIDESPDLIFIPCLQDKVDLLSKLIEKGFNPNYLDSNRENLAHYATKYKSAKILQFLCKNYPNLFFVSNDSVGDRPIHMATRDANIEALRFIAKVHPLGILN